MEALCPTAPLTFPVRPRQEPGLAMQVWDFLWGAVVDERELIKRAAAGDEVALGHFVRAHYDKVFGCAMRVLRNPGAADDATQETFIRAWKALPGFDGRSAIGTRLYRICVNVCLSRIRGDGRRAKRTEALAQVHDGGPSSVSDSESPEDSVSRQQILEAVGHAVDELPEALRITVSMVLLQGVPQHVVADVMDCSPGTVAWRVHEARRRLRRKLRGVVPPGFFRSEEGKS